MSDDSTKKEEESLFLAEMGDVTPLKPNNKLAHKIKHKKTRHNPQQRSAQEIESYAIDDVYSSAEMVDDCPDILSFARSGLQYNVLKKLRQGKNPVEHRLDLHGLTVDQARKELLAFLSECEMAGLRHGIIVHGKGYRSKDKPVIKPMVNRWLRQTENVLAFHTAQAKDGGGGAVYILLKKASAE